MRCGVSLVVAGLWAALALGSAGTATAGFVDWYPRVTGNDTGGIIPYSPDVEHYYREMAADHCARWGRLSHITSVHRRYGDYIGFICIDKPWIVH